MSGKIVTKKLQHEEEIAKGDHLRQYVLLKPSIVIN